MDVGAVWPARVCVTLILLIAVKHSLFRHSANLVLARFPTRLLTEQPKQHLAKVNTKTMAVATRSHKGSARLSPYDVLCGRNRRALYVFVCLWTRSCLCKLSELGRFSLPYSAWVLLSNNVGNRRFRVTVSLCLKRFTAASTRRAKSLVIDCVTRLVQDNGGRFLTITKAGRVMELSPEQAHRKVGHALRDMAMAVKRAEGTKADHTFGPLPIASCSTVHTLGDSQRRSNVAPIPLDVSSIKKLEWMTYQSLIGSTDDEAPLDIDIAQTTPMAGIFGMRQITSAYEK